MARRKYMVINGFKENIEDMLQEQEDTGVKYKVSAYVFNTKSECVYEEEPVIKEMHLRDYSPGGSTALYDAIGKVIFAEDFEPKNTIITIMTDGEENASRRYTKETIKQRIKEIQDKGCGVVYFGSNQDAWAVGGGLGISNNLSYSDSLMGRTMRSFGSTRSAYASGQHVNSLYKAIDADSLVESNSNGPTT